MAIKIQSRRQKGNTILTEKKNLQGPGDLQGLRWARTGKKRTREQVSARQRLQQDFQAVHGCWVELGAAGRADHMQRKAALLLDIVYDLGK